MPETNGQILAEPPLAARPSMRGNAAYVVGSRESIAIAAVMASQFAAVAAVAACIVFRERLSPAQRSGVVAIVVGVAMLAAVRA